MEQPGYTMYYRGDPILIGIVMDLYSDKQTPKRNRVPLLLTKIKIKRKI